MSPTRFQYTPAWMPTAAVAVLFFPPPRHMSSPGGSCELAQTRVCMGHCASIASLRRLSRDDWRAMTHYHREVSVTHPENDGTLLSARGPLTPPYLPVSRT